MTKLRWRDYKPEVLFRVNAHTYVLRLAKAVSYLEPSITKIYGDKLLVVEGHYNKRGYCIGYSLKFEGNPSVLVSDFYLILDYVSRGKEPKNPTFPKLAKNDPKICLVKFGDLHENRMYSFIYRKKRDG